MSSKSNDFKKFFAIFFVVVVVVMFWNNFRRPELMRINSVKSIDAISTIGNELIGISGSTIYIWPWDEITEDNPTSFDFNATQIAYLGSGKALWVPKTHSGRLSYSDMQSKPLVPDMYLDFGWDCLDLAVSSNGNYAAAVAKRNSESQHAPISVLQIKRFSVETEKLEDIYRLDFTDEKLSFQQSVISKDGRYLALIGSQNKKAFAAVIDMDQKQLLWQEVTDLSESFNVAVFSPDSQYLYTAGEGLGVYGYDTQTGELANRRQRTDYKIRANTVKHLSCIAISDCAKILAVGSDPSASVWMWNLDRENQEPFVLNTGEIFLSYLAFSPGSKLLATGSFRVMDEFKIWELP